MTRKNLFLMLALTLLVFAGQASAQGPGVSLTHVPDAGGIAGIVSGQGTTFTVRISQTGVNDIPGISALSGLNIDLAFDASKVSLTNSGGLLTGNLDGGIRLTLIALPGQPLTVPASVDLTFTTVADVTGMEFSIEITGVSSTGITLPLSEKVTFNSGSLPPLEPLLVADASEVVVLAGGTATATVTAMNFAAGATVIFDVLGEEQVTTSQDGATLTLMASGPAEVTVTASDGTTTTDPISVTFMVGPLALEAAKSEVMVPVGGTGSTTVIASGQAEGAEVTYRLEEGSEGVDLDPATGVECLRVVQAQRL